MSSGTAAIPSALSPFRPDPEAAAAIFSRIASGRESLLDLAAAHHTSLEALALWLESPEAQSSLASISAGLATFARIGALARIPAATDALHNILTDFRQRCARAAAASPADSPSRSASASTTNPAATTPAESTPSAPAAAPSPMDDFRERRLIYSVACLLLRITRTPDRVRPAPASSASPARDHSAQPHAPTHAPTLASVHAHPHADSSLRSIRPLRPDADAIDPLAHWDRPAKPPGPADRLERLADPAARARQSPESWRAQVRREIATVAQPHELPQILESMTQMDDETICQMLRCAAAEGRGHPPPSSPRSPPPNSGRGPPPNHSPPPPRHTPKRNSPGALLAAAGAPSGPAP